VILLIDNYDSFTYNLYQYIAEVLGDSSQILVKRNDEISIAEIEKWQTSNIILSPGPCTPNEAGIGLELVKRFAGKVPILGICLGHQTIAQACGVRVVKAKLPVHGKKALVSHYGHPLFKDLADSFEVGRYHSLVVEEEEIGKTAKFNILARSSAHSNKGVVMAIEHRDYKHLYGLQFHPESLLTPDGKKILANYFALTS